MTGSPVAAAAQGRISQPALQWESRLAPGEKAGLHPVEIDALQQQA